MTAEQHVPSAHVAGVRQDERAQQDEHQDRDHDGPCAGVDLTRDPAFGRLDVGPEGVEVPHRARSRGTCQGFDRSGGLPDAGHAQTDTARALPGGVRVTGAGAAVRQNARVGDEVVRRRVGDRPR